MTTGWARRRRELELTIMVIAARRRSHNVIDAHGESHPCICRRGKDHPEGRGGDVAVLDDKR